MGQSVQPASARATQASALVVAQAPGRVLSDLDADHFTRSVLLETDQLSDRQEARVALQPEDASPFSSKVSTKPLLGGLHHELSLDKMAAHSPETHHNYFNNRGIPRLRMDYEPIGPLR